MCTTQSSVLVVRVVPLVCDDAVVRRTLVLIAVAVRLCFRRSHFSSNFAVLEVFLFTDVLLLLHVRRLGILRCWPSALQR